MSMLSAQADKLRELATKFDEIQSGATRAVRVSLDMGSTLREAADTIWELRESVHRERAEADKLRTQLVDVTVSMGRVEERCAKLREAVKRMHKHIRQTCGECDGWYCSNFDEDNECCVYDTLARELGIEEIEVDG